MPIVRDFRRYQFSPDRVNRCGHFVADNSYWKLYAVENTLRVVIASVLTIQIGPHWWTVVSDPKLINNIQNNIQRFRAQYASKPRHAVPGNHDIYFAYLSDLNKIIGTQANQFRPVIPDIDRWRVALDGIRLPRNLVGHMNFPNYYDRERITKIYQRLPILLEQLHNRGIPILIP